MKTADGLDRFDAHQLGVRLNIDVDVKNSSVFDVDSTNVKTACAKETEVN